VAADNPVVGSVASLWRYPVKSMQGEELNASAVTERGLLGDRAYALLDTAEGRVASAKNPRKWPRLFDFRAAFAQPPRGARAAGATCEAAAQLASPLPPVRITLPDGTALGSDEQDRDRALSAAVGRSVALVGSAPDSPILEEYWPDLEGLPHRDAVTDEKMPRGTFFDLATVHLLTTATLDALRELYPQGRFEVRRFRPNVVIASPPEAKGFVEQGWVGRTVALGDEVRLEVTGPCPRCVMITLPQADLPRDLGILRTAVQQTQGHIGVYARVVRGGTLRRGDVVRVE
jgi:uncharacterized protein YcbX